MLTEENQLLEKQIVALMKGGKRLRSHSGSSSTTNNTESVQIARQHMQCDKLRQEAAIMAGNLVDHLFDFSCMH
ncbi:hypothetical protein OIU76_003658 [Salix suchowensis]|nr:hypothetical protein OIU76_003658 [Salix suchowensis]